MTRRALPPTNVSPSGSVTRYRDRILIEDAPDGVVVTTTDVHLPQRIAKSLKHAYHGDFFDIGLGASPSSATCAHPLRRILRLPVDRRP